MGGSSRATGQLSIANVGEVKKALSAARRTTEGGHPDIIQRFVEPRAGLLDQLMSEANHLIEGRRGTGKSTILQVLRHRAIEDGTPVAFVDMEKHKHRNYPDVLVELLIDVFEGLMPSVPRWQILGRRRAAKRNFDRTIRELRAILSDPSTIARAVSRKRGSGRGAKGTLKLADPKGVASVGLEGSATRANEWQESGSVEYTKIERLRDMAPRLSRLLSLLVQDTVAQRSVIFIDDFYYINTFNQPYVLDYLHQVCKGTAVWLKVCGVGSRLKPYRDGDPPVGMEPENDIFRLGLDVTLENFVSAKRFLERIMDGILSPLGLNTRGILTETARDRIILASGGAVARDYINLIDDALDISLQGMQKKNIESELFRIGTEDIMQAARRRLDKKEEEDLIADARDDYKALRARWSHVLKFARSRDNTQFVLFKQENLSEEIWGNEIQQLQNLRFLHRITTAVPNTGGWRGIKTVVVMIDLATAARQRLNQEVIPFWKSQADMDRLRRAEWVYDPNFDAGEASVPEPAPPTAKKKAAKKEAPVRNEAHASNQDTLFGEDFSGKTS